MSCHSFKQVHVRLTSLGNMKTTCVVPYTLRLSWWINFCIFCELAKFTCASMHRVLYYKNENHKTFMRQAFLGLLQNHYPWKKIQCIWYVASIRTDVWQNYMVCIWYEAEYGSQVVYVYVLLSSPLLMQAPPNLKEIMTQKCDYIWHHSCVCMNLVTPNSSEIRDKNSVAKATSIIC